MSSICAIHGILDLDSEVARVDKGSHLSLRVTWYVHYAIEISTYIRTGSLLFDSVPISLSFFLCPSLSFFLSLFLYLSPSPPVSLCVCLAFSHYLYLYLSLFLSISLSLSLPLSLSLSLSLSLCSSLSSSL